jgi:uncharacterized protein
MYSISLTRRGGAMAVFLVLAIAACCRTVFGIAASTKPDPDPVIDRLLFPGHSTQGMPDGNWQARPNETILDLVAGDGVHIGAVFAKGMGKANVDHRAAIIYFYGNGTCMAESRGMFDEMRGRGFDVIIPDYEGYGMSGGNPSETGCYAAADAAYDYLLSRADVDKQKIVAVGWSLGSAVAIDLARRRPVAAVVTFSALTNMAESSRHFAAQVPVERFANYQFDSLAKIPGITCPMLMMHGSQDALVPPEMTDRLAKAAKAKVTVVKFEGAGHNDIFRVGGKGLFDQVQTFIKGLQPAAPTTQP